MQNKHKKLVKNTIIIFIGKVFTQFISFLLVPIYTRYLNTSDFGYVDLLQSYITLISPILLLRLDSAVFRFLIDARRDEDKQRNIIRNAILVTIFQIFLFAISSVIIGNLVDIKYYPLIIINVITLSFFSIFLQLSRGLGKNTEFTIASVICGITNVIITTILIIIFNGDASSILIASSIGNIIATIFVIYKNKKLNIFKLKTLDKKSTKDMIRYSLPMVPDGLSWWICNVSDRTIISFAIGDSMNGLYAISSKFANIIQSASGVFNTSWQESASVHINEPDKDEFYSSVFKNTVSIFGSITLLLLASIPLIFNFLVSAEYIDSYLYIPVLLFGNFFNALANTIGAVYIAKKQTTKAARTTIICALINIIINIATINHLGLWGASISTPLSFVILFTYRYFDTKKYVKIKLPLNNLLPLLFIALFSTAAYYLNHPIINIASISACVLYSFLANKKNIFAITHSISKKMTNLQNNGIK